MIVIVPVLNWLNKSRNLIGSDSKYELGDARVAELVDALDLGSSTFTGVGVRVPPLVPICFKLYSKLKKTTSGTICTGALLRRQRDHD